MLSRHSILQQQSNFPLHILYCCDILQLQHKKETNFAFTFIIIQLLKSPIPAATAAASYDKNTDDDQLMAK